MSQRFITRWGIKDDAPSYNHQTTLKDSLDWAITHILVGGRLNGEGDFNPEVVLAAQRWLSDNYTGFKFLEGES